MKKDKRVRDKQRCQFEHHSVGLKRFYPVSFKCTCIFYPKLFRQN